MGKRTALNEVRQGKIEGMGKGGRKEEESEEKAVGTEGEEVAVRELSKYICYN